ncbi:MULTISPECIES: M23 family metallopeptidase [unclassified Serratia (in: enterobacteria)]|uniref:M23 family metallopeptidase n=1 Tax=unclassified Serratia (in: enterobacteria) TaxID=2647522 RepID=UPI0030762216
MLISPPRLRNQNSGESDADWVERMIPIDVQRNFPINASQAWHGGVHLMHSDIGSNVEYIRAIADGTVISLRQPDQKKRDIAPLNYNGSTDCGYVLIKHETEIGSGEEGKVQYYSLYMHMGSIKSEVKQGSTVSRKDPLGQVGHIDGQNGIHFQIFCDDANLKKLVGRETTELDTSKNGRTNIVYGDMHFYLPTGTKFYPTIPANDGATATESTEPLYVTMRFEKGSCSMITRRKVVLNGSYVTVGEALVDVEGDEYEHNLCSHAEKLYPDSPSAGYELLRFGRVINTEYETLVPANAPLWRTVNYPGGRGVVNLADSKITKFSDGDFPHWTGWILIDDDADDNSQWNSPTLFALNGQDLSRTICNFPLEWDEATAEGRYSWLKSPTEAISLSNHQTDLLGKDRVGNKQETSYTQSELQTFDQPAPSAYELAGETISLADKDWDELMAHIKALCFDTKGLGLPSGRVWHFEPRQFITHFRKCLWQDATVIAMVMSKMKRDIPSNFTELAKKYQPALNKSMLKYIINTPVRQAHFFGQGAIESGFLASMQEISLKQIILDGRQKGDGPQPLSKMNEADLGHWYGEIPTEQDNYFSGDKYTNSGRFIAHSYSWILGNCGDIDAQKFRGRGFKMLTGRSNYAPYWVYRGWLAKSSFDQHWWTDRMYRERRVAQMRKRPAIIERPQKVTENEYNCVDTGGYFIRSIKSGTVRAMDKDRGYISPTPQNRADEAEVVRVVTKEINGGDMDLDKRKLYTAFAKVILL